MFTSTRTAATLALLSACGPRIPPEPAAEAPDALALQQAAAAEIGKDQTLEQVRLASIALARGERRIADQALRQAVGQMMDFQADGQFRAIVGAEKAKEWKGEPYEKMMAFLYLGILLYEDGDYGNALAMSKSALLADTGTTVDRYRSDFVPAFVLQALCYSALGEDANAGRALQQAIDAQWMRAMIDHLTPLLEGVDLEEADPDAANAAQVLLLSGLPAGVSAHPQEPLQAMEGAMSWASDLRRVALEDAKGDWPDAITGLSRSDLRGAFDVLEPMTRAWQQSWQDLPSDLVGALRDDEAFLRSLLEEPGVVLWVETGRGPAKVGEGDYGQILRIVPRDPGEAPRVTVDGRPVRPHYLDSVTYQAQTRGGRKVDAFLKGKAVFKDTSLVLGFALAEAGDLTAALAQDNDDMAIAGVLYLAGIATWIAGAATNPAADLRQWEQLPDALWLVRSDAPAGEHAVVVDGREHTMLVPDDGHVSALLPRLAPGGPRTFGEACRVCAPEPLAVPIGEKP